MPRPPLLAGAVAAGDWGVEPSAAGGQTPPSLLRNATAPSRGGFGKEAELCAMPRAPLLAGAVAAGDWGVKPSAAAEVKPHRHPCGMPPYGLRLPASASCKVLHLRPAGRCPNNSSLFPPLAAVVIVAYQGRPWQRGRAFRHAKGPPTSGGCRRKATGGLKVTLFQFRCDSLPLHAPKLDNLTKKHPVSCNAGGRMLLYSL